MSPKHLIALVCALVALILTVVAVFVPPARGHLIHAAVAVLAFGVTVWLWP